MKRKIIILTGEIQTGKTTLLSKFCSQTENVAGILTPIINQKRNFYNINQLATFNMEAEIDEEYLEIGKYKFSKKSFAKAKEILTSSNIDDSINYLIIDEIGPLELKNLGLYDAVVEILKSNFNFTLILVIRKALVDQVIEKFELKSPAIYNINDFKNQFKIKDD